MKKILTLFIALILNVLICTDAYALVHKKNYKEYMHNIQTHYIASDNPDKVLKSAISVLYDSDFMIEDVDYKLGYIRAKKTFKARSTDKKRIAGWSVVLAATGAYTVFSYGATAAMMYSPTRRIATEMKEKTFVTDVNVFVEQCDKNQVKIRFIPIGKVLQNADGFSFFKAAPVKILRMKKPDIYNEFFSQIDAKMEML